MLWCYHNIYVYIDPACSYIDIVIVEITRQSGDVYNNSLFPASYCGIKAAIICPYAATSGSWLISHAKYHLQDVPPSPFSCAVLSVISVLCTKLLHFVTSKSRATIILQSHCYQYSD